jgi:hypothetical protein
MRLVEPGATNEQIVSKSSLHGSQKSLLLRS